MVIQSGVVEGTIQISSVVTIMVGLVGAAAGVYSVLVRFAFETFQKATEKRFVDLERDRDEAEKAFKKESDERKDRVHTLELSNAELKGEVRRLNDNHERSSTDVESIREIMVLRSEWEPRQERIEKQMDEILTEIRRGRYGASSSTPRFPAVTVDKKEGGGR